MKPVAEILYGRYCEFADYFASFSVGAWVTIGTACFVGILLFTLVSRKTGTIAR